MLVPSAFFSAVRFLHRGRVAEALQREPW